MTVDDTRVPDGTKHGGRVAVIGSFRQHIDAVRTAVSAFRENGWTITSPPGGDLLEPNIEFVRFEDDNPDHDDCTVQTVAMHRILGADLIYVVAPDGYIGRTTCYEVGRAVQCDRAVYFSNRPLDLPLRVPDEAIVSASRLALQAVTGLSKFSEWTDPTHTGWERDLIELRFRDL